MHNDKILIDALFPNNIRIAHTHNDELENFDFQVAGNVNLRGSIYLGKIVRIENSLQAAFVDFGHGKNGFLSISEIHPDYFHLPLEEKQKLIKNIEEIQENEGDGAKDLKDSVNQKELGKVYKNYNIASVMKVGQLVLVQAIKEERGNKGATLTTYISLAGRYCVYMANMPNHNGISRKIHNITERQRIRDTISEMHTEKNGSVVVRTAGEFANKEQIVNDYTYLSKIWTEIKKKTLTAQAPSLIYEDGSIITQIVREYCNSYTQEIIIEGKAAYLEAEEILKNPAYKDLRLTKHTSKTPIFVSHNIEDKISELMKARVEMKSGAFLIIQQTEALISIDVNSGRSTGASNVEETALKTNREAAHEIAKQLRLRNLSGLIVVDFIDMGQFSNRRIIEKEFKSALEKDRVRVQILSISSFGLMEISRQRTSPTLLETAGEVCPHCDGMGFSQSIEYSSMAILRQITNFLHKVQKNVKKLQVDVQGDVLTHILNYKYNLIADIQKEHDVRIVFGISNSKECKISDITKLDSDDATFHVEKDREAILTEPTEYKHKTQQHPNQKTFKNRQGANNSGGNSGGNGKQHKPKQPVVSKPKSIFDKLRAIIKK